MHARMPQYALLAVLGVVILAGGCRGSGGLFRRPAVPDRLPLGHVWRQHSGVMQTNGEAADFILYQHEFVGDTLALTPAGRDHVMQIAARAPMAPFPIIVERSPNNFAPQLDAARRQEVVNLLLGLGVADAEQRTLVAPAYGRGITAIEGEFDYYNSIRSSTFGAYGTGSTGSSYSFGGFGSTR